MNDLRTALRLLRQEVSAAFKHAPKPMGGNEKSIESINVSLGLIWERGARDANAGDTAPENSEGYRWTVAQPGQAAIHTVQFTLKIPHWEETGMNQPSQVAEITAPAATGNEIKTKVEPEELMNSCIQVFGAPGFDNSARAEVYGDIATSLEPRSLLDAVTRAGDGRPIAETEPLHLEIRRLRRLLGYSPVGVQRGAEILRGHIERGDSAALLRLLSERWHFGSHWELPGRDGGNL